MDYHRNLEFTFCAATWIIYTLIGRLAFSIMFSALLSVIIALVLYGLLLCSLM